MAAKNHIKPQEGPQTDFLSSNADIVIYGGAGGGGKTFGLLLDAIRHYNHKDVSAICFRRTYPEIVGGGGLWDTSQTLFPLLYAQPAGLTWTFPSGYKYQFSHMQHEKDRFKHQGNQYAVIHFDELTHFTEKQFWYLVSRNRSTSGVQPYIRATCNPDPDSFVRELIDWWIGADGFPITDRAGVIRYFIRVDDSLVWFDTRKDALAYAAKTDDSLKEAVKSFTFIPAKLEDNKILMEKDPTYKANLLSQDKVTRMQLLGGNWDAKHNAGDTFKREWFEIIHHVPEPIKRYVRYYDRASTEPNERNRNPDWTAGALMGLGESGKVYLLHVDRFRSKPGEVKKRIKNVASQDVDKYDNYELWLERDPGQAGVAEMDDLISHLSGLPVKSATPTGSKYTRALPFAAQAEFGNVKIVKGEWVDNYLTEVEQFSDNDKDYDKDDQVDASSGAFNALKKVNKKKVFIGRA